MSQSLAVKEVEFNSATLMAVQTEDGEIRVGVRWITDGIGLNKNEHDAQVKKIKGDLVLNKGASNLTLPTNGGMQEVLTLDIDFLPLWLAKISITPKMKENSPEVVSKLVEYQLKAKDALANAFVNNKQPNYFIPKTYSEALMLASKLAEENELLEIKNKQQEQQIMLDAPKVMVYDNIADGTNLLSMNEAAKTIGIGRNTLFAYLRGKEILMKNNLPYESYKKRGYFDVVDIPIKKGNEYENKPTTRVTSKGLIWLTKLVK